MEEYGIYFIYFLLAVFFVNAYVQAFLGVRKDDVTKMEDSQLSLGFFVVLLWGVFNTYSDFLLANKLAIMIGITVLFLGSIIAAFIIKKKKKMFIIHSIEFVALAFLLHYVTPFVS